MSLQVYKLLVPKLLESTVIIIMNYEFCIMNYYGIIMNYKFCIMNYYGNHNYEL